MCVIYVAVANGPQTSELCARFCSTWNNWPPGADCDLLVACQGGPLDTATSLLFSGLGAKFWPRVNDGAWDLGAYIEASRTICADYDMLLCLGESNHFWKAGWLKRLVEVAQRHGPGMYGPFATHVIRAHLQTTAFFCAPRFLREYPLPVIDRRSRYELEHGERALWRRLHAQKIPIRLVTWDGDYGPGQWRQPPNVLWKGDQSNLLWRSNHSLRWAMLPPDRKLNWQRSADRPFV